MRRAAGRAGARLRGMALLVVGLLGPLVGCGAAPPEVGVAITSWPGYEYFYLAEQWQLAEPHGLRLRVRQFSSLEDQRLAYLRGDVDVVTTTTAPKQA